jgi:hypothetical protein
MIERLQNIFKSAEIRRQEQVNAYIDGEMTPDQRVAFEAEMTRDPALKADVTALRRMHIAVRRLPRQPVPRNFVLDPAQFRAAPAPSRPQRAYPALRAATALAGILFIFLFTLTLLQNDNALSSASMAEAPPAAVFGVTMEENAAVAAKDVVQEAVATQIMEAELEAAAPNAPEESVADEALLADAVAADSAAEESVAASARAADDSADMMMTEAESSLAAAEPGQLNTPTVEPTPVPTDTPEPTPLPTATPFPTPLTAADESAEAEAIAEMVETETDLAEAELVSADAPRNDSRQNVFDTLANSPFLTVTALLFLLLLVATLIVRRKR